MHISPANSRSFPRKETAQNVKPNEPGYVTMSNVPQGLNTERIPKTRVSDHSQINRARIRPNEMEQAR